MERVFVYDACYDDSLQGVMARALDDSRLEVVGKTVPEECLCRDHVVGVSQAAEEKIS